MQDLSSLIYDCYHSKEISKTSITSFTSIKMLYMWGRAQQRNKKNSVGVN